MFELYGIEAEDFTAAYEAWKNGVHPDDLERMDFEVQDAIAGDKEFHTQFRVIWPGGQIRHLEAHAIVTRELDGTPKSMIGVNWDITDRRKSEEKLKAYNEELARNNQALLEANEYIEENRIMLQTIINATPDLVWLKDVNGVYLNCNKRFEDFFGYSQKEIIGKTDYDFLDKELADFFTQHDQMAMKANHPSVNEEEITFANDGHSEILETIKTPLINKDNKVIGVLGVGRDITERKKNENKLKESEEKFRNLYEKSPFGIIVCKMLKNEQNEYCDFLHIDLNESVKHHTGFELNQIKGKKASEMMDPVTCKKFVNLYGSVINTGKTINYEEYFEIYDRTLEITAFLLYEDLFILNFIDISKRKEVENDLIFAKEKAEESDRLKSSFLANMSHEIRTPMNGILGFTSLLENPKLSSETREYYINIIQKSGKRMLDTVNDLINISKIETGQEVLHLEKVVPCKLVNDICEFFRPLAEDKGLKFIFEQEDPLYNVVDLDVVKFNAIVRNLIKNAIKFTIKGSITVSAKRLDDKISFSVKDTGPGIKKERQDAVFDRFVQEDISGNNAYDGAGLGLSIVKSYVDMMGGTIRLESEVGEGSCFHVLIPVGESNKISKVDDVIENKHENLKLSKVLIAEDDDISFQLLSIGLKPYVDVLMRACDGREAVEMAKENSDLELILMDVKMPVLNGLDATKEIRKFNKKVLIISQTAYALSSDKKKSYAAGCNAFVTKPIELVKLLEVISSLKTT